MVLRADALSVVQANVKSPNLIKHMVAVEAIMRALAKRLGEDADRWGMAGLLHDADIELAKPEEQGLMVPDLAGNLLDAEQKVAIASHNSMTGHKPSSRLAWALYSADHLSGLITAAALVLPEKKLANLTVESVKKRFGEARFAKGANREQIASCSELGLSLDEFIEIGLNAMSGISDDLGL